MADAQNPPKIVHSLETKTQGGFTKPKFILILIGALILGTLAGFFGANYTKSSPGKAQVVSGLGKKSAGVPDKKQFPDRTEGLLKPGGIDGEGNFHLERPGGESQNVYLTSSTVDLSQFVGKKIRVWGQTFQGQTAGWLMDVGYVESL